MILHILVIGAVQAWWFSTRFMYNVTNILNASNYENICDFSVIPPYGKYVTSELLSRDATIFCKTDFIDYLFNELKDSKNKYVLLTHHSDFPIDKERWSKKPICIKKWFAINPLIVHQELIAIPLGVKTHKEPYFEPQYMTNWFAGEINRLSSIKKTGNIYCNWNTTNLDRNQIIKKLQTNNISFTHDNNIPFDKYIERMAQHKYVISPPGNGIDCHRTWEALYVGCIPIVLKHPIYDNWDLPIIQINDYSEITQELLNKLTPQTNNAHILNIDYWSRLIKI